LFHKNVFKAISDKRIGPINQEQMELLEHIKEANGRLSKIIMELLGLSRMEAGNIQLNPVLSNPMEIVNLAIGSVKFIAQQRGMKIKINTPAIHSRIKAI
jgi:NtrC-family two-component system sensor histidine kinase KinB